MLEQMFTSWGKTFPPVTIAIQAASSVSVALKSLYSVYAHTPQHDITHTCRQGKYTSQHSAGFLSQLSQSPNSETKNSSDKQQVQEAEYPSIMSAASALLLGAQQHFHELDTSYSVQKKM